MNTEYWIGATCCALGLVTGLQILGVRDRTVALAQPATDPTAGTAPLVQAPPAHCIPDSIAVSVSPDASLVVAGRPSIRFKVRVAGADAATNSASYSLEVLDTSYRSVGETVRGPVRNLARGALLDDTVQTGGLPDGYYQVRISGSIADGKAVRTNGVAQYISVKGGNVEPVTVDDFLSQPGANSSI